MKQLLCTLMLLVATSAAAGEKSVSVERDFGTLYGTLLTPDNGSQTVAIIIAGSGPTDRNGNSSLGMGSNSYYYLAQALEKAGIASLRYDKRGVAASKFDSVEKMERESSLEDYIDDAVALADHAAGQGFEHVVLIGHSEGSLIALRAAQLTESVSAVVCVAGAGYPLDEIIRLQLANQLAPSHMELLMQADEVIAALKRGERVESYPPQLAALFNPRVQPFVISCFRYDPRKEIREVTVPILIVNGDNDIQIPADNAQALAKAQPRAELAIIPGMTHVLKKCEGRTLAEQAQTVYIDSSLPLDEDFAETVVAFIDKLK
ncbi:alpha/beta fold hydrolase [uncultured Alistipes sp.]|uniref:alpha/beta hydrolase n=1 Tax=uncultured Alistipes sp. TaxID=538949 RepID=UPI0025CE468E|nr:alpha/beta fold hydrolase [uncultured Alistipes sp.]